MMQTHESKDEVENDSLKQQQKQTLLYVAIAWKHNALAFHTMRHPPLQHCSTYILYAYHGERQRDHQRQKVRVIANRVAAETLQHTVQNDEENHKDDGAEEEQPRAGADLRDNRRKKTQGMGKYGTKRAGQRERISGHLGENKKKNCKQSKCQGWMRKKGS
jgi:hypothetical protein